MRGVRAAPSEGLAGIERVVLLRCAGLCCFLREEIEFILTDWVLRAAAVCLVGGGSLELSGTNLILDRRNRQGKIKTLGGI